MNTNLDGAPPWAGAFLAALEAEGIVAAACTAAGVASGTAYRLRDRHRGFRDRWDALPNVSRKAPRRAGAATRRDAPKIGRFLQRLAETSNIAAAAVAADLPVSQVYQLRRTDPEFAKAWYAALAEGYDNLEMELLAHLRGGSGGDGAGPDKRKFDTAAALRCLAAHRESVAREKGRRTLAEEAATIASINAKIDALRAQAKEGEAAIRAARKAAQATAKKAGGDGEA